MVQRDDQFYLVRSDVLPESVKKTLEAKALLDRGKVHSVHDAVRQVDLSRSAFYKYRDAVYPFQSMVKEKIITLFFHLEDRSGTLSRLLTMVSTAGCNVLTIHQTIPLQGKANLTLSLDTAGMTLTIEDMLEDFKALDFIDKVEIVSSGA